VEVTDKEIAQYGKELRDLTDKCSDVNPESRIREELKRLAWKVGTSTCVLYVANDHHMTGDADTSEIIHNIHQALQTASMANMCGRATEGYEIATKAIKSASKQFQIAAAIAFLSAVAACVSAVAALVTTIRV
jgi:hypothetical protein